MASEPQRIVIPHPQHMHGNLFGRTERQRLKTRVVIPAAFGLGQGRPPQWAAPPKVRIPATVPTGGGHPPPAGSARVQTILDAATRSKNVGSVGHTPASGDSDTESEDDEEEDKDDNEHDTHDHGPWLPGPLTGQAGSSLSQGTPHLDGFLN